MLAIPYEPGADPFWDGLGGQEWQAFDVVAGARVYVLGRQLAERGGRIVIAKMAIRATVITADLLRSVPVGRLEAQLNSAQPADLAALKPLHRQPGEDGSAFSDRVAEWYRAAAVLSPHPAKLIARYAGVPVTTVHGWVREARLRGKLPAGRRAATGQA